MTTSPAMHKPLVGEEHDHRLNALRAHLSDNALSAVVITSPETIFYLTGYSSTAYYMPRALIVTHEAVAAVVCDVEDGPLYTNSVVDQHYSWSLRQDPANAFATALTATVPAGHACGIQAGVNFSTIFTPEVYAAVVEHCGRVVRDVQIDHLRKVKSPSELANSRRAGALAAAGLRRGLDALGAGVTELQISTEMLVGMIEEGGEVPASYPYTYFGPRSWRRMELPSHRALQKDEPYYLECGATAGRYGASILRTGYAGTAPTELRSIHTAAVSAFEAMLGELRPGVRAGHIDDVATLALQQHGLADSRINKVAYSMGVGFPPGWGEAAVFDLHPANDRLVEEGMVFHLVSLLMSETFGAVGISETVEVTDAGARSLTECSRSLREGHL
ncbi:Xaa-Pro peptidase family protein [Mycobacterium sp. 21AC1]|uniref:M24 family metallopeptidase n=1 Tax=[Mycobacterium] appelbergii TaxID=2939269 RepID=UPI0029391CC8|nr:Xaa-Pro peptidase family protein [Mycobacterium sp. 21AC1]MDV3125852.1 Xaa-Pro peptidase family protein [Mycobacterium sp. 21AC1]